MKTNIIQIVNNELSFSFNGYETCNYFSKDDFKNHQISSENIWLVPLNLNWENKDFFGLDIGVEIRKKLKSKAPIIFHSYIPEKDIFEIAEKDKDFKYKLLFTPECYYLDSNNLETDLDTLIESSAPISEFCLADINHYIFNAKGRIDELCHNLKNDLTKFDNKEVIIDNFKDACEYEIMIENIERLSDIIINLKNELNLALNKDNTYFDVINKYKPQIISLLPISADDETVVENKNKIINWEVIYLEDEEHIANDIKNWFHENGVRCHLAKNENEVITFLENNKNVVLFITDIRLMDKSKKWHTHQGYDVIEQIAKHSKIPLVFAVLTSKKGSIINSAKQKLNYQIFWENKDNVLHSKHAFDIYFNRLKELADKNFVSNIL